MISITNSKLKMKKKTNGLENKIKQYEKEVTDLKEIVRTLSLQIPVIQIIKSFLFRLRSNWKI